MSTATFDNPGAFLGLFNHFKPYYERMIAQLAVSAVRAPEFIVDLGAGTGDFTALLGDRFPSTRVLGLDTSTAYIREARERYATPQVSFDVHPAGKILTREDVREADAIFMKGCYHLFEVELPLSTFVDPRFRQLRVVVVIEKTARSLDTYPVPKSARDARQKFVSLELGRRRLATPPGMGVRSFLYGETIEIPTEAYVRAVETRQFSYLKHSSDAELHAWALEARSWGSGVKLFEENIATAYYPK